jgi:hypothetical protein
MNCSNYHVTKQDPDCPYCVIKILTVALEKRDPTAPELTPAMMLLTNARRENRLARRAAE